MIVLASLSLLANFAGLTPTLLLVLVQYSPYLQLLETFVSSGQKHEVISDQGTSHAFASHCTHIFRDPTVGRNIKDGSLVTYAKSKLCIQVLHRRNETDFLHRFCVEENMLGEGEGLRHPSVL